SISIVLFLIIIVSIVNIFRKLNKLQKTNVISELESEVNELVLELNQTADRNINIIEDKIKTLSAILQDADKRIKILGSETGKIKPESIIYNQHGKIRGSQDNPVIPLEKEEAVQTQKQVVEINKKDKIIELHNNGFSCPIIASRVGLTVGEVELIISLVEGR
ncbi:MAG: hypothetical protein PF693_08035, partial [Spirochaetia bacterium]|nr:hypothetical protein [Spirochaetia bacterium]